MCLVLSNKDKVLLYKFMSIPPRINCTCTVVTMAKIQFLTILLTVTCFLGGVVSVTDKELEVRDVFYPNKKQIVLNFSLKRSN